MVETLLTIPIVLFAIMSLFVLGYLLYVRIALQVAVHTAARELASHGLASQVFESGKSLIAGPGQTFGLDPNRMRLVPLPVPYPEERPRIIVAACYSTGMPIPKFVYGAKAPRPPAKDLVEELERINYDLVKTRQRLEQYGGLMDDLAFNASIARGLASSDPLVKERSASYMAGVAWEQTVALGCDSNSGPVLTAKVVMRTEPIRHAP